MQKRELPRWVDGLSLLALFFALLAATWMRWPDALVDFWRNLYLPWRLSEGALLYEDVADWYGPLPTLAAGALFSLVGPGLDALVALNGLVALGCLFTLHRALLLVGDRLSAWTGAASFVLIFCFGQYTPLGNYNFLTPYTSQATWGFFGVLLTLLGALSNAREEESKTGWLVAGIGVAIAWLSKAECLMASLAVMVALSVVRRRVPPARFFAGFAALVVPVWLLFTAQGGLAYGARATHQVLLFTISPQVRESVASVPFFAFGMGFDTPLVNLGSHLGWGLMTMALLGAIVLAARRWSRVVMGLGIAVVIAIVLLGEWRHLGRTLLLPVIVSTVMSAVATLKGRQQWTPLFLLSVAALSMLARMPLNVRIIHYGFTLAVLATVTIAHLLTFEAPRQAPFALRLLAVALVLGASARLTEESLRTYAVKSVAMASGRDAYVAFSPAHHKNPGLVSEMIAAVEKHAPSAKTLVVFPDGGAVSYLTRKPSPIPQFEFNPVSLAFAGGPHAVAERLRQHPPDVVLLCSYDLRSHGTPLFGITEASGSELAEWLRVNYRRVASGGDGPFTLTGHDWDLFVLRGAPP